MKRLEPLFFLITHFKVTCTKKFVTWSQLVETEGSLGNLVGASEPGIMAPAGNKPQQQGEGEPGTGQADACRVQSDVGLRHKGATVAG